MNILIVDDDAAHGRSVRDLLAAHNYPADVVNSGRAGVSQLIERHTAGDPYQVLILDLNIPDLAGVDVLDQVNAARLAVKTIVVSGESDLAVVTPILKLGALDYMRKPFDPGQLINSVANAIARFQLEAENQSMQRQAEQDAELYGFLLNASPDFVYMLDADGCFRYVNHHLEGVFEDTARMQGSPWTELFAEQPGLIDDLTGKFAERRRGSRATVNHEFEFTSQLGSRHFLEISATGLYQETGTGDDTEPGDFIGTYGVVRDVTESRRTRRELQQSQRKFYSLFVDSPEAVFISGLEHGNIIERNPQFVSICGAMRVSPDGTDAFLWENPQEREDFVAGLNANPSSWEGHFERLVDGQQRYFELRARRLELEGTACMIATLHDRTAERNAERDRLALQGQLEQASRMEAVGQVAGGIAHDFNNILASIIGYAELVMNSRNRLEESQVDQYLHEVVTAGHRARDLISQMLTFTRAQRGEPVAINVKDTITDVSKMLRAAIPSTIELRNEFQTGLAPVMIDPVQLQQVVINLLINARDAISSNGVIGVSAHEASTGHTCSVCSDDIQGEHVCIRVSDNGHGIEAELIPRIFEMYFTTRAPGQGTGFGLWMINNFVHEHGGHLVVDSVPGEGTSFEIYLPRATATPAPSGIEHVPQPRFDGRIMVVDDEVSVANFIGEVLRDKGFPTVVFTESPQAMKYLDQNIDKVSLVLTDGNMPLISGVELAERVRSEAPDLPIIFITGYSETHSEQALARIGVTNYLRKPFSIQEMLDMVIEVTDTDLALAD